MNRRIGLVVLLAMTASLGGLVGQWIGQSANAADGIRWRITCSDRGGCYALHDDSGTIYWLYGDQSTSIGRIIPIGEAEKK
jgi:hypothetical protein